MAKTFELGTGILIDPDGGSAYVMLPEGGVAAVSLQDGSELWRSDAADKPLLVMDTLLVGQGSGAEGSEGVPIRMLRTQEAGSIATESIMSMPQQVVPLIEPSAHMGFHLTAQEQDGAAMLSWEYRERPLRGLPMEADEDLPGEALPGPAGGAPVSVLEIAAVPQSEETVIRGQALLTPSSGDIQPVTASASALESATVPQFPKARADIAPPSLLGAPGSGSAPLVFLSADGAHRLESTPEGGTGLMDRYRWRIFAGDSLLGSLSMHLSFAPFAVAKGRVMVELQPHSALKDGALAEEPMQLVAFDLSTGAQVWSTPLRDVYAVPEPPH